MSGDQIFWICIAGIIGVTLITGIPLTGLFWRKIIRDIKATELKLAMIDRGYTPEDIERVIRASESDPRPAAPAQSDSEREQPVS
jgi:hypothetical protein